MDIPHKNIYKDAYHLFQKHPNGDIIINEFIKSNDFSRTQEALKRGFHVDIIDSRNMTPISYAIKTPGIDNYKFIKLLLNHGSHPTGIDLVNACFHLDSQSIKLLIDAGANVNEQYLLNTPLNCILERNMYIFDKLDIIKHLLNRGAIPNKNTFFITIRLETSYSYNIMILLIEGVKGIIPFTQKDLEDNITTGNEKCLFLLEDYMNLDEMILVEPRFYWIDTPIYNVETIDTIELDKLFNEDHCTWIRLSKLRPSHQKIYDYFISKYVDKFDKHMSTDMINIMLSSDCK